MQRDFNHPTAINHLGKAIYFVSSQDGEGGSQVYHYNVLHLDLDSASDDDDWQGTIELPIPEQVSLGGFNMLRVDRRVESSGLFQVLSDQRHVYLIRAADNVLYANRYLMVEAPNPNLRGRARLELQPAWEVRFQRSGKPDTPSGKKDTQSFLNLEGVNFVEPIYELPLGAEQGKLDLDVGWFDVRLLPTANPGELRWQIMLINRKDGRLYSYSVGRTEEGWFAFDSSSVSSDGKVVLPSQVAQLMLNGEAVQLAGAPTATVYNKHEAMRTSNHEKLKMQNSYRYMLVAEAVEPAGKKVCVVSLDSSLSREGRPAFLAGDGELLEIEVGEVKPSEYTLQFDGAATVQLSEENPIILTTRFTQQAWILPSSDQLGRQYVLGARSDVEPKNSPPVVLVTNGALVRVGFGNGETFLSAQTASNALVLDQWNNVAAIFDGERYRLFVNGNEVELVSDDFSDQTPVATPLSVIGGGESGFVGEIDEVRVWEGAQYELIRTYLYKEIPQNEISDDLLGYWRLDEGRGTMAMDRSKYEGRDGELVGPQWVASSAPVAPASAARTLIDDQGLTLSAGIIIPNGEARFPLFGAIAPGSRPSLLSSYDGLLHLYYQGQNGDFLAAQFDTSIARPILVLPWAATASDKQDTQHGELSFAAKQTGTLLNQSKIRLLKTEGMLLDLLIDDHRGNREEWTGLIDRADYVTDVLAGRYVGDPTDPSLLAGTVVYYDDTGRRRAAFHRVGEAMQHGYLLLVSRNLQRFFVTEVRIADGDMEHLCEVGLTGVIETIETGSGPEAVPFGGILKGVPRDVSLFVKTLNGASTSYDYHDRQNMGSGTRFYELAAGPSKLMVAISDASVEALGIAIKDATELAAEGGSPNPNRCDVTIVLTLKDSTKLEGRWQNVDRKVAAFTGAIKASSEDPERRIAAILHFDYAPGAAADEVSNTDAADPSSLFALLSFLDVFSIEPNGSVANATIHLTKSQGLHPSGWTQSVRTTRAEASKGSALFSTYLTQRPTNGYPAVIEVMADQADARLVQAGLDGGWLVESPRNAVWFRDPRSAVAVDAEAPSIGELAIPGALTQEAWVYPDIQKQPERGAPAVYPRVVHANPSGGDGSRYMLGLSYSSALQFLSGARLETNDTEVVDLEKRLFPDVNRYSVQFYVKADLTTPVGGPGRIFEKRSRDGKLLIEELRVDQEGRLTYSVSSDSESAVYEFATRLENQTWTFITMARDGATLSFYIGDTLDGTKTAVPEGNATLHNLILGGNDEVQALEMELNVFTVWRRVLTLADVELQYQRATLRDEDGLQLLWAMDRFRDDNEIFNTALATETLYAASVSDSYFWDYPGPFCRAFASVRETAVESRDAVLSANHWNHLAAIYDVHYGVQLEADNYADCGNDDSFNVQDALTIEGWITPRSHVRRYQVILSKFEAETSQQSYELGINEANRLYLKIRLSGRTNSGGEAVDESLLYFQVAGSTMLEADRSYFVAATVELEENTTEEGKIEHSLAMRLYCDGQEDGALEETQILGNVQINKSTAHVNIGRTKPSGRSNEQRTYQGGISDLYLWSVALDAATIEAHFRERATGREAEGIVSFWNFAEQTGRVAFDQKSDNNALFAASDMWITYHDSATYRLMVNGRAVPTEARRAHNFGGYEKRQVNFGGMRNTNDAFRNPLRGKIDEIRLWRQARTSEQINDNMERYLTGRERGLAGYWRFDAGTGTVAVDQTGRGNDGRFDAFEPKNYPTWVTSEAPVNNEAGQVLNALGGLATDFLAKVTSGPTAVEYADTQTDSAGEVFSVLKRAYIYRNQAGSVRHVSGYKVGDLKMVHLGQVQTSPTVIGYVEGTPPIPSENMTRPFYLDPTKPSYLAYYGSTSVRLTQQASGKTVYGSSRSEGSHLDFGLKIGPGYAAEALAGQFVYKKITKIETKFLVTFGVSWGTSGTDGRSIASAVSRVTSNYMYNCGDWEQPNSNGEYYLRNGERRFLPNNEGYALVKSATADMYTLHLENTGTLVGVTIVPNPDIPEDVNLIYFPLNPKYIKNGTLDGKLGLQNDPDYPEANVKLGSYFDPIQAYALQRKIEKREQELKANYVQFNAARRGKSQDSDLSSSIEENLLYNWESQVPKKDMVSTYVWTAAGGLYSESTGYVSQLQEMQSGSYNFSWSLGFDFGLQLMFGGPGLWSELSLLGGTNWSVTVQKSKEEESALQLEVHADPDGFLNKYLGNDRPNHEFFSSSAVPGKVDSYRFKTFYIAPNQRNFEDFFSEVVEPGWLNNSRDPRAVALREARSNPNQAWRVLHRVTFVSRIPPEFQAFPLESQAPDIEEPVNLDANSYLLDLVRLRLPEGEPPTPVQIGKAVRAVLSDDLVEVIPWWATFLEEAREVNSEAYVRSTTLTSDTIDYVVGYYASLNLRGLERTS